MGNTRLQRERKTIAAMFQIYCRQHHAGGGILCAACQADLDYCLHRIDKCPYGEAKPACKNCVTHCYSSKMQERVKQIMRFAGPKMIWRHPLLAMWHMLAARRKP
jgi:hypothetical protein